MTVSKFTARVDYRQPSYEMLKQAFDMVFDGYKKAKFRAIDLCKDVPLESSEIKFQLIGLNKRISLNEALVRVVELDLRPALYEEMLGFAKKYPEEQKEHTIIALGSFCRYDMSHCISFLDGCPDYRLLRMSDDHDLSARCCFLAVCK